MSLARYAAAAALLALAAPAAQAQIAPTATLQVPENAPPPRSIPAGPHEVVIEAAPGLPSHTIYRPANLDALGAGERLPVIAWGNGACSNAGLLFSTFLSQVASHGYLVIASGPKDAALPSFSRARRDGEPRPTGEIPAGQTSHTDLIAAIDWAEAESDRAGSPFRGRIDKDKVAVMGQSCGGLQATAVAGDPRIDTMMIWNSGVFVGPNPSALSANGPMGGATKESLARFHAPTAYISGGPSDLAHANGKDDFSRLPAIPAFFGSLNVGHGGTFDQPRGGWYAEVGVKWLDWQLKGDAEASRYFVGADCVLCQDPDWETEQKHLD